MKEIFPVFDFDGTIVDSISHSLPLYNLMANEHGFRELNREDFERFRSMSLMEALAYLNIPKLKIPALTIQARKLLRQHLDKMKMYPGMPELLNKLNLNQVPFGVLTSNSKSNVEYYFQRLALPQPRFIDSVSILTTKASILKKKRRQLNEYELVYIGDEVRDIHAARQARCKIISVDWGFNTHKSLKQHQPDLIVSDAMQLLTSLRIGESSPVIDD